MRQRREPKPIQRELKISRRTKKPGPYYLGDWLDNKYAAMEVRVFIGNIEQIIAEHKDEFKVWPGGFYTLKLEEKHSSDILGETLVVWPGILETIHPREYSGPKTLLKSNRSLWISQADIDGIVADYASGITSSKHLGDKWGYPISTMDNLRAGKVPIYAKNRLALS